MNVILVCGPPGSGKTTYVKAHKRWGDLVLDRDWLQMAVSGESYYNKPENLRPFAEAARNAIINRMQLDSDISTAWVIIGGQKQKARDEWRNRFNVLKVIMLETSPQECLRRITQDDRRAGKHELWEPIVAKWWTNYEPDTRDVIIRDV